MGNVDCRNLLSNNQNGNEIKYTFSVDTHHNLNININSITNFPEDIKIINTQNPIILNNSLNINNNSISSQEMVFSPKEIKSISTPSFGSEENKKIIEENGNFCKNVSKIENIHEKSEESNDSESENENDNEKGKGKEKENQDNNNPNQNHNIRRMSTILNFEHRRMPIEIIEEKQREKSKLSINQQIKINSQKSNNDNEQKNIETPKDNNNNFNKLSFNINFNQFQTNYNGIQNNNFPINNILNNNNNIINNFKDNNNSLNICQGNNNGITNLEKENIPTKNFENKDNPTNNLKNNNNPINKLINNNNPINNFENKNNPINFQNNKNQINEFQNPYNLQNNNLLINHNNIPNHNIQNCNYFIQKNLKKLNVPQNLNNNLKNIKKKENQKKLKNLNIINIIPLEKRTKVYDNTILLNGYFNVFSRKTFPNSKLETTLRFIILTRSELKIYRSLETKLFQKNPLRRISLFNISKCDLFTNDNSRIVHKNLELNFNFFIEFITINKMVNNDETLIIHHETNYKHNFNYKLINKNYNPQRRKKKISFLSGSTLDNGLCKSKNNQINNFDNNSEILVLSSNDEKLINQWVTVINYFIN